MNFLSRAGISICGLLAASMAAGAAAPETTLVLARPHEAAKGTHGGLLARQLVRQAFLMTAREQFGLATRDIELRQTGELPAKLVRRAVEVWSEIRPGDGLAVEVHRLRGVTGDKVLATKKPLPGGEVLDYVALAERCEELSRQEFPTALLQLGFSAGEAKPPRAGEAKLPAEIERQLARMKFLSQFAAIRSLHAMIRRHGEAPEVVGGLVRGYANLAVLTQPQLDVSSKAFAARSLIYAQKLVTRSPESAFARWHRGYALALAGLHQPANKDLADAARASNKHPEGTPAWAPLVESLCRFDTAGFAAEKTTPAFRETALLFHFVVVERAILWPTDYDFPRTAQAAEAAPIDVAAQLPDDERAISFGLTSITDVKPRPIFTHAWYQMLAELADAPPAVRQAAQAAIATFAKPSADSRQRAANTVAERQHRRAVLSAIQEASADDSGELPYSALAAWIADQSFLEAWRESSTAQHALLAAGSDQSAADVRTTLLPLIERHPLSKFIEARLTESDSRQLESAVAAWRGLDKVSVHAPHRLLAELFTQDRAGTIATELETTLSRHCDDAYGDLVEVIRGDTSDPPPADCAKRLLAVSPDAPLAAVAMVKHAWPEAKAHAGEWERRHAAHIELQAVLADRFLAERRYDDARRCLTRYVRLSPDEFGYTRLAETHKAQGDTARWLATLEEYLRQQTDDPTAMGGVHATIARHFIQLGQLTRALPYAEQAAESGLFDGSLAAAECHEYAKNWPLAEKYYRQADERFDGSGAVNWLQFCIRTGYGSANAARARAAEAASEISNNATADALARAGYIHLLLGQPRTALRWLRRSVDKGCDAGTALHLCLLAIEQKQPPAAEAAIKLAIAKTRSDQRHLAELAESCDRVLCGKAKLDEGVTERMATIASPAERADAFYFAGRLFELQGDRGRSRAAFRRCAACPTPSLSRTLACAALRAAGEEPNDARFESEP
jgi:tetratricopeptide (TPR) repeat protein